MISNAFCGNVQVEEYTMRILQVKYLWAIALLLGFSLGAPAMSDSPISLPLVDSKLWGGMYDVQIVDQYAFCALTQGLLVVDVSDPTTPVIVGRRLLPTGAAVGLDIEGNLAYIADGAAGLQIVDISTPENPTWHGEYAEPEWAASDVDVEGQYAYLALGELGLGIIDISNPASPTLRDVYDTLGSVKAVRVIGDYAFMADDQYGLHVANVAGSGAATFAANISVLGTVSNLTVSNDTLVYCVTDVGLSIVDVAEPLAPTIIGSYTKAGLNAVHIVDQIAYVGHNSGIDVLDVSDPTSPSFQHTVCEGLRILAASTRDSLLTALHNGGYDGSLRVLNIAQPGPPVELGQLPAGSRPYKVDVLGNFAAIAGGKSGVNLVDVTDPYNMQLLSTYDTPGWARDVALKGNEVYVADRWEGLLILEISEQGQLVYESDVPLDGASEALVIDGDYAYVMAENSGLHIVNISDPAVPVLEGSYLHNVNWNDVAVQGNYAYITGYDAGMRILDISDPTDPKLIGSVFDGNMQSPKSLAVAGEWVYFQRTPGIHIVSVADPANPYVVDVLSGTLGDDLLWHDGYLYVADLWHNVKMYNTQYPGTLVEVGTGLTPSTAHGIALRGGHIFVADSWNFCSLGIRWPILFCGDMDGSSAWPDIADLVYLVDYMFNGGPPPPMIEVTDVDGSGGPIDIADLVYLVDYMFAGGPAPACVK